MDWYGMLSEQHHVHLLRLLRAMHQTGKQARWIERRGALVSSPVGVAPLGFLIFFYVSGLACLILGSTIGSRRVGLEFGLKAIFRFVSI